MGSRFGLKECAVTGLGFRYWTASVEVTQGVYLSILFVVGRFHVRWSDDSREA